MKIRPLAFALLAFTCPCFANVTISTSSVPSGVIHESYAASIRATGGCTPYRWAIVSGSLPAGVTGKASSTTTSWNLSGTPTTAAKYSFTVKVTGCGGHYSKASYAIVVEQATSGLKITTTSLPNGIVGNAYSARVSATGGCTPYKWNVASGALPPGLTLKPSSTTTSVVVAGTPSTAAKYYPTIQVTGCGGAKFKASYQVAIQATTNHVVDLSWTASSSKDVAGYNIYRSSDATSWKKSNASLIASTLYSDATVASGSTYYYAATTVDIYGKESAKSTLVKVSIP